MKYYVTDELDEQVIKMFRTTDNTLRIVLIENEATTGPKIAYITLDGEQIMQLLEGVTGIGLEMQRTRKKND